MPPSANVFPLKPRSTEMVSSGSFTTLQKTARYSQCLLVNKQARTASPNIDTERKRESWNQCRELTPGGSQIKMRLRLPLARGVKKDSMKDLRLRNPYHSAKELKKTPSYTNYRLFTIILQSSSIQKIFPSEIHWS